MYSGLSMRFSRTDRLFAAWTVFVKADGKRETAQ
jgi:hypothetical protein